MRALLVLSVSGLLLASCKPGNKGDSSSGSEPASGQPKAVEPAKTVVTAPPPQEMRTITATPELVEKGKTFFAQCAACHGTDGKGKTGIGPSLVSESFLAGAADEFLFTTIKNGREGTTMVPWGSMLGDDDIKGVIAYIRSLNPVEPAKLDESPLKGNVEAGQQLFQSVCAACHGRQGGGYQETANGTGIGRVAFLKTASDGYLRHIIRNGKDQTKMRGFDGNDKVAVANLDDQQIEDVVAYLRTSAW